MIANPLMTTVVAKAAMLPNCITKLDLWFDVTDIVNLFFEFIKFEN